MWTRSRDGFGHREEFADAKLPQAALTRSGVQLLIIIFMIFFWFYSLVFIFQALAIGCKVNYCLCMKVILSHLHLVLLWQLNSHHWPIFILIPIGYRLFQFFSPLLYCIDQAIYNLVLPLMSFTNIHLSSFLSLPGKYLVDAIFSIIA